MGTNKEQGKTVELIKKIIEMIKSEEFRKENVFDPDKNFIRSRSLAYIDIIRYVLGNTREPIEMAVEDFADKSGSICVSPAAMCKARAKIKYTAFKKIFTNTVKELPITNKYNGYQVIAVDGMDGELPKTKKLMEKYANNKNAEYPKFHAVAAYDIMNEIFISAYFDTESGNERFAASKLLDDMECENNNGEQQIFVYDRGFPSVALIQKLNAKGKKFVMRVSESFLKEVNEFTAGNELDKIVNINYTKRRAAENRVSGDFPYNFDLRCVRISLETGEEEICISNLDNTAFPSSSINELYNMRWGIEVGFNYLKNAVFIEEFSSKSENGIKQDFYSTLWNTNMINLLASEALLLKKTNLNPEN